MNKLLAGLHAERVARQPKAVRTVTLENGVSILIVEQHGSQLGSSLWTSALPFSTHIHRRLDLWTSSHTLPAGKNVLVLELGAGCGTVGIAAALVPAGGNGHGCRTTRTTRTVVLTDKPEVCSHLHDNLAANAAAIKAAGSKVSVRPLTWVRRPEDGHEEWTAVLEAAAADAGAAGAAAAATAAADGHALLFDVVLASECVYELKLLALLLVTAERAMGPDALLLLGFCRRGGALCPLQQAETMVLERFEHAQPMVVLDLPGDGGGGGKGAGGGVGDGTQGTDTSVCYIYSLRRRKPHVSPQ